MLRTQYLTNIRSALAIMSDEVRLNVICNRLDVNISSEMVWCGLLNLLYGWELKNANSLKQNFPAVDLVDPARKIAVQVTSDNSRDKILKTLEKLEKAPVKCEKLVMMFLTEAKKYREFQLDGLELVMLDRSAISRALEELPTEKLGKIAAYLDGELGLNRAVEKPRHRLPGVPSASPSFVPYSRDTELKQIRQILAQKQPALLWGLGGMGKTETAIQLAQCHAPAKGAYFLRFRESLRQTILDADFFQGADGERRDLDYDTRMGILRTEYPGSLLIIDNFDCPGKSLADLTGEDTYSALTAMDMLLVFTTRNQANRNGVEIKPLGTDALIQLMRGSLKTVDVPVAELKRLIDAVDGHTLMADLMAKTLEESWGDVTPEIMLRALKNSTLADADFPEVENDQNRQSRQRKIYGHLKALFDLTGLSEADCQILRCATLLPEDGMSDTLFRNALPKEQHQPLRHLISRGFLRREGKLLTIHPVVREACREELKPVDKNCDDFLDALWNQVDFTNHEREKFTQLAEVYANAAENLVDWEGRWLNSSGRLLGELQQIQQEKLLYEKYIPFLEKRNPDSVMLATAYMNLCAAYCGLGDYHMAQRCVLKTLEIQTRLLPPIHPELASSYAWLGTIFEKTGNYHEALKYNLKALEMMEKMYPFIYLPYLAASYGNVGRSYESLGDYPKALEYQLQALSLFQMVLPPLHPDLATAYNDLGCVYGEIGDCSKELDFKVKSLEVREKILPPDHPDVAQSYNNVGIAYSNLDDYQKALDYHLKALDIWEKVLPPDHPSLATTYNNVGCAYGRMGEYEKALEYLEKALVIVKKALPAGHPHIAVAEGNIARFRREMEQQ